MMLKGIEHWMRIRYFRQEDLPTLVHIEQLAAQADQREARSEADFAAWLAQPELDAAWNAFVITDDDDEMNPWGQAGTLDGLTGEIVGYTTVQLQQDEHAYHLLCRGSVLPQFRRQNAGRVLLIGALNRARIIAEEFDFEAEQADIPIYFEALLPTNDPASAQLAAKCEMALTDEPAPAGLCLYRRQL